MAEPEKKKNQALSLLAGILEETQSEADAERERLEADLRKKEEDARLAAAAAEAQRREESERRLAEEEQRRRAAAARRAAEEERLHIEDLKARGEWKEPEVAAPVVAAVAPRRNSMTAEVAQIQAQAKKKQNRAVGFAIAATVLLVGGGAGAFYATTMVEYVDSTTAYAKSSASTLAIDDAIATIGFNPIPDPIILQPEVPVAAPTTSGRRGSSGSRREEEPTGIRIDLGGSMRDR
jgi:hypothetical protein